MNTYSSSDGQRHKESLVRARIRLAKQFKIQNFLDEHGYIFCEECGSNHNGEKIDCAHTKSVKWCKENGCVELAWDVNNIKLKGRSCHQIADGLDLQYKVSK